MNIDFTIDFDKLLQEAQLKREEYEKTVDSVRPSYICDPAVMDYPPAEKNVLKAARKAWLAWVDANITSRGLDLHEDMLGRPIAITAVLAGKKN
jgi:hypothetical protein